MADDKEDEMASLQMKMERLAGDVAKICEEAREAAALKREEAHRLERRFRVEEKEREALSEREGTLRLTQRRLRKVSIVPIGLGGLVSLVLLLYVLLTKSSISFELLVLFVMFAVSQLLSFMLVRSEMGKNELQLEEVLSDFARASLLEGREKEAERVFSVNEKRLRRYYDVNLSQNRWVFYLGVACVAFGIFLALFTLNVLRFPLQDGARGYVAVVGAASAVLTEFVAALFVRMHSSATRTLSLFHYRLLRTHQLLLGNLIASGVADEDLSRQLKAEMTLALFGGKQGQEPIRPRER